MTYFSTLFDKNYLSRGLALYESLNKQSSGFHLFILCLDDFTYTYLKAQRLNNVELIPLAQLEQFDTHMAQCQHNRTRVEYYFTISPCLPLYLLNEYPDLPYICSIDADLYFYQDPYNLLKKFDDFSILITSHHFSPNLGRHWHNTGIYNVSFQAFRNDDIGKTCLEEWRKQCINWCHNYYDALYDRFADQKYLETWVEKYGNKLMVVETPATNLAIWNVNQYRLENKNNRLVSNNLPIVFYHFSNVKIVNAYLIQCGFYWAQTKADSVLLNNIYFPYIQKLIKANLKIFGTTTDVLFQNETGKRFALFRRAMRDRALMFILNPTNIIFYLNFSWINDVYEGSRHLLTYWKERYSNRREVFTYEKNEKRLPVRERK